MKSLQIDFLTYKNIQRTIQTYVQEIFSDSIECHQEQPT